MAFAQQLCEGRDRIRGGELAQVDLLAGPGRTHRGQRWNDVRIPEGAAKWIGLPALGTPRVKHEIVEIPENEIPIAFIHPKAVAAFRIELEQELAIQQQFEQIEVEGGRVAAKPANPVRPRQRSEGGGNGGIANPKQRPRARRFQYHLVAAPAQISKARQHDGVTLAELCALRPVLRDLGFDDHEVLLVTRKGQAIFEKPVPRQSMRQEIDFPGDGALAGKGRERQAIGQISRAVHRGRAEVSQIDKIAIHGGGDASVRLHLKGEMTVQSGGDDWRDLAARLFPGSAHERPAFQVCGRNGVSSLSSRGRSNNPSFTGTS